MTLFKKVINKLIRKSFDFFQAIGFHIVPVHFYEPIPDTKKLNDSLWKEKHNFLGINLNHEKQIELLDIFSKYFNEEYQFQKPSGFDNNTEFSQADGEILYCMIRHLKPRNIIEIGSGYSTLLMIKAIEKNKKDNNVSCRLTSIDPYPKKIVEENMPGFFNLIKEEVQDIGLDEFKKLGENDILFIDSSHVLKIGSDVQYEYLDIIPSLNKGVSVHIHDIFFPSEYPKKWVLKEHRFFNEQYFLQAFLAFNNAFEVILANNYINTKNLNSGDISKEVSEPSSFWIKKII